jgi:hypothetical protein
VRTHLSRRFFHFLGGGLNSVFYGGALLHKNTQQIEHFHRQSLILVRSHFLEQLGSFRFLRFLARGGQNKKDSFVFPEKTKKIKSRFFSRSKKLGSIQEPIPRS